MEDSVLSILKEGLTEKNVTFLLGAGASSPYFSSLGNFEDILSSDEVNQDGKNLIKSLFYLQSIKDNIYIQRFMNATCYCHDKSDTMLSIIDEYSRFLHNGLEFLKVRNSRISPKRINVVTTNYDLFIESAIDGLLEENPRIFFNDGTNGYGKKLISTDNFNKTLLYAGIFDNYSNEMPVINLIKCHGSVNWKEYTRKNKPSKIQVTTNEKIIEDLNHDLDLVIQDINQYLTDNLFIYDFDSLEGLINEVNSNESIERLFAPLNEIAASVKGNLLKLTKKIDNLQIVLPTKKKFETTLIQEHYFNMLRLLSYELEKKQSLLIVFGFSFQDEHITEIVQRSLNNPSLLVIVFCFTDQDKVKVIQQFNFSINNVPVNLKFITPETFLKKEIKEEDIEPNLYSRYTVVKNEGKVFKYSNVVSLLENEEAGTSTPILNFSSINKLLEMDIVNKYESFKKDEVEEVLEYDVGEIE